MSKWKLLGKSHDGYSLVETLVVLTIVFLLIAVSTFSLQKNQSKKELESFLQQFSKDFHFAQMYAISHQQIVIFTVDMTKRKYVVSLVNEEIVLSKSFPKNIEFQKDGLPLRIYFTSIGNVSNFGNWAFKSKNVRYLFTILIGRGRHYYREY